jgi:hypothetical protein
MIHLRTRAVPLLLALATFGRVAAAQNAPEPAPPPLPPPPPAVYNPPAPPPYTGPSMMGTWDKPRFHDRFYLRLSLGGGTMGTNADFQPNNGVDFETQGGSVALDLAIGGTPAPGFVIGGDFAFQEAFRPHFTVNFREGESNANTVFGLLGFFLDWFPDPRGGFHVGGTFGYADLSVAGENDVIVNDVRERGVGGAVRVGYDLWISNQWSLGLLGQWVGGWVTGDNGNNNTFTESDTVSSFALLFTALYH